MNNSDVSPSSVSGWIKAYYDCKQDTKTAIDLLEYDFIKTNFDNADDVVNWFVDEFQMWGDESLHSFSNADNGNLIDPSYYRAFIAKKNDDIINLRVSRHYSTENTIQRAYKGDAVQPDIEHHIIIERKPIDYKNRTPISKDCVVLEIHIFVDEWLFSEIGNKRKRNDLVSRLIRILTYGCDLNESIKCVSYSQILTYKDFIQTISS